MLAKSKNVSNVLKRIFIEKKIMNKSRLSNEFLRVIINNIKLL